MTGCINTSRMKSIGGSRWRLITGRLCVADIFKHELHQLALIEFVFIREIRVYG